MKKYGPHLAILAFAAVFVMQLFLMTEIRRLNDLNNRYSVVESQLADISYQIRNTLSNVESIVSRDASIITSFDYTVGDLDLTSITVPLTVTVTPRSVTEETKVSVQLPGEVLELSRNGIVFSGTSFFSIFEPLTMTALVEDGGVTQNEVLIQYGELFKERFLPQLGAEFHGMIADRAKDGVQQYNVKGDIRISGGWLQEEGSKTLTDMRLIGYVDGAQVFSNPVEAPEDRNNDLFFYGIEVSLDETFPLKAGELYLLTLVYRDAYGLWHQTFADVWLGGEDGGFDDYTDTGIYVGEEVIYDGDGAYIYKPSDALVERIPVPDFR